MTPSLPVLDEAEIAVVGGGPAGSIAAFTLASEGHDVVLIDKRSFPRDKACGDGLTSSAVAFLYELGLEQVLDGAQPVDAVRFFVDFRERESITMHAGSSGRRRQPCCIPRKRLDHALVKMACAAGARLVHGYVTRPLQGDESVVGVELTCGTREMAIHARHVIGADGATSRLRRQLGERPPRAGIFAYAVRRYVCSDRPLSPALEIYAPLPDNEMNYGYGWLFPIDEKIANVGIGYMSAAGLPHPRSINELLDSFSAELQGHQAARLGNLETLGRAIGGPFGGDFSAERCQLGGVIFLGDAAQTTDPITGEGVDQAMRSAYTGALALHRAIRRQARPVGVVQAIRRSNLRLGQDSAMLARLAHELLKRRAAQQADSADLLSAPGPLLSTAVDMLTADVAHPSFVDTPAGQLAAQIGCTEHLVALEERLREEIRSELILASELLQREVCAGVGPIAALTVIASELACESKPREQSVDAGLCVELLSAFPAMLSRVSTADARYPSANNALAVMIGDYSLCRALTSAPDLGAAFSEALGEVIEANSEGIALLARDQAQVARPVGRYIEWARLTSGANISLAAGLGARLAGAEEAVVNDYRALGESLGLAVQICEDILALVREDPMTGRRPRHVLEEGHFSLPILLALAEDPSLTALLTGEKEGMEWDRIVDRIRQGQGLIRAVEICKQYAGQAEGAAVEAAGNDSSLAALCKLPERCLASLTLLLPVEPQVPPAAADLTLRLVS